MLVKISVVQMPDMSFDLITGRGHRVGPRLLTTAPKKCDDWPVIPEKMEGRQGCFDIKDQAYASALSINLYLKHAWEHRSKSKDRGRE